MLEVPQGRSAEPFWILATNFELVNLDHEARVVMFTSAGSGEGKSTTVANLAVALARRGRRVTLVDLDLRNASLARLFGIGESAGLTSVALRHEELGQALVRVTLDPPAAADQPTTGPAEEGSLFVLPAGTKPPNPAEFTGSRAVTDILAELRPANHVVLVDATPLFGLSDAIALASSVDAVVVVVDATVMKRHALDHLQRVLSGLPATKLGYIATSATVDDEYVAYGSSYGGLAVGSEPPSGSHTT
jgi:succinoglycan biosynthesis transport protein ExoP